MRDDQQRVIERYLWVAIGAAVATIALKVVAAAITGSVGFLSDALESGVNLVAAGVAMWAVRLAAKPADLGHHFGHGKAEYLSSAIEGTMIFVAAAAILWTSIRRLLDPVELEQTGFGLALSTAATLINLAVGGALVRAGRHHRSIALAADGKHLLTDVVTSIGVLVGIALVTLTGWARLDPIIALLVGLNILWTGAGLVRRSASGMLDASLPPDDLAAVNAVLDRHRRAGRVSFHALRTREAGRQRFVYMHVLVPDEWTVKQGHDVARAIEREIADVLPGTTTFTHIEPRDDPASYGHDDLPRPVPIPDRLQVDAGAGSATDPSAGGTYCAR